MLRVTVAASDGSGAINEDVVGWHRSAVWVIDGASGIGANRIDGSSDAAWLAQRADSELQAALDAQPELPTADLMRRVMTACRKGLATESGAVAIEDHDRPSAAFAMVRQLENTIELSTLGDCRIAFAAGDDVRLFGTTALAEFEARTIALARQILERDPDLTPARLRELLLPQLRANRRMMNRHEGYWVLGTDPDAADHLDQIVVPVQGGETFALASDGFLRLVELFEIASPADLLEIDGMDMFTSWLGKLRALERAECSCQRYPRVKVHDDATFAHCVVEI